jgi:hypothetical protein
MDNVVDVGSIGVRIVAQWLSRQGFRTRMNFVLSSTTDIEAVDQNTKMLIQVRTAVLPAEPVPLTAKEVALFQSRAWDKNFEPWEAMIQLDSNNAIIGQIMWRKL